MRGILVVLLFAALLLNFTSLAYAKTPGDKLVRGVSNVLGGWVEIPQTIDEEWRVSKNMGVGLFAGLFKGVALTAGRMLSGAWDILTFPAAIPRNYEPLYKPDYPFDRYGPSGTVGVPAGDQAAPAGYAPAPAAPPSRKAAPAPVPVKKPAKIK